MKSLIIGMGEVGQALFNVLQFTYSDIQSYDKNQSQGVSLPVEIVHICFPYSENFIHEVHRYLRTYQPKYLIIHSTVPVGTTKKIAENADFTKVFYSPIRGHHENMEMELRIYVKYIASDYFLDTEISKYFEDAGIPTKTISDTDSVELMKLLELYRYGLYLAGAKEQETICKYFGKDYDSIVSELEKTSNEGLVLLGKVHQCQPLLYPFKDFVGGHCTVEDMEILLKQLDKKAKTPLLSKAFDIDRGTVIWPNCNIYPDAKIGKGCSVGQFTEIDDGVVIGNNVRIGAFCFIPSGVTVEDDCFIAPRVAFSNDKHPPSKKAQWGKILVKKGAVIGMGAVILPGITIGKKAVVGAGSVVTKDVPDDEVWYGQAAHRQGVKEEVYP